MAWLTRTNWSVSDNSPDYTDLNAIGLDIRTWGGDQDAAGHRLLNFGGIGSGAAKDAALYDFAAQEPGGTLTAATPATVTLTPVPQGVNGTDVAHYLWVDDESVLITGGTAVAGEASGTITFTPANNHSAGWTIRSATAGIQEAFHAATSHCSITCSDGNATIYGPLNIGSATKYAVVQLGAGLYTLHGKITLARYSYLIGRPASSGGVNATTLTKIIAANGTNLARMFELSDSLCGLRDLTIDGNKANNASAQDGVYVTGGRFDIANVNIQNCKRHGLYLDGTGGAGTASQAKVSKLQVLSCDGAGIYGVQAQDLWLTQSELMGNLYGAYGNSSGGWRLDFCEFSGNTKNGLYFDHAAGVTSGGGQWIVMGSHFAGNLEHDIYLNGDLLGATAGIRFQISGNKFWPSARAANTYDYIYMSKIRDSVISGNTFVPDSSARYAVNTVTNVPNLIIGNVATGSSGAFGTAAFGYPAFYTMTGLNLTATGDTFSLYDSISMSGGNIKMGLAGSSAGLPSGALWVDAAAGNVVKRVP
jgi:hypothetical protein